MIRKHRHNLPFRATSCFMAIVFTLTVLFPPGQGYAWVGTGFKPVPTLPLPGAMVTVSPAYLPPIIKGITIHPENPLLFDFIVHPGDDNLEGQQLKDESTKLIKYFMASLTVPEDQMWVNLSPYEKDRIVPDSLGQTEMGRDLLAQDYLLKQLTASLMYPEDELGSEFWDRVYKAAYEKYGTSEIPMNTFNKVWIMPDTASIYENGTSVFVVDSHLKVMLEEDYMAMEHSSSRVIARSDSDAAISEIASPQKAGLAMTTDIIREILIPAIEKEVNEGKTFANLRQIYNSVILATWYKQNLKESLLGQVYVDQNKTKGIDIEDKQIKEKIYNQYLEAFKVGVYDYIKEDYDPATRATIPRKYFSGGVGLKTPLLQVSSPLVEPFQGTFSVTAKLGTIGNASSPLADAGGGEAMLEKPSWPLSGIPKKDPDLDSTIEKGLRTLESIIQQLAFKLNVMTFRMKKKVLETEEQAKFLNAVKQLVGEETELFEQTKAEVDQEIEESGDFDGSKDQWSIRQWIIYVDFLLTRLSRSVFIPNGWIVEIGMDESVLAFRLVYARVERFEFLEDEEGKVITVALLKEADRYIHPVTEEIVHISSDKILLNGDSDLQYDNNYKGIAHFEPKLPNMARILDKLRQSHPDIEGFYREYSFASVLDQAWLTFQKSREQQNRRKRTIYEQQPIEFIDSLFSEHSNRQLEQMIRRYFLKAIEKDRFTHLNIDPNHVIYMTREMLNNLFYFSNNTDYLLFNIIELMSMFLSTVGETNYAVRLIIHTIEKMIQGQTKPLSEEDLIQDDLPLLTSAALNDIEALRATINQTDAAMGNEDGEFASSPVGEMAGEASPLAQLSKTGILVHSLGIEKEVAFYEKYMKGFETIIVLFDNSSPTPEFIRNDEFVNQTEIDEQESFGGEFTPRENMGKNAVFFGGKCKDCVSQAVIDAANKAFKDGHRDFTAYMPTEGLWDAYSRRVGGVVMFEDSLIDIETHSEDERIRDIYSVTGENSLERLSSYLIGYFREIFRPIDQTRDDFPEGLVQQNTSVIVKVNEISIEVYKSQNEENRIILDLIRPTDKRLRASFLTDVQKEKLKTLIEREESFNYFERNSAIQWFITPSDPESPLRHLVIKIPRLMEASINFAKENMGGIIAPFTILRDVLMRGKRHPIIIVQEKNLVLRGDFYLPKKFQTTTGQVVDLHEQERELIHELVRRNIYIDDLLIASNYGVNLQTGQLLFIDHMNARQGSQGSIFPEGDSGLAQGRTSHRKVKGRRPYVWGFFQGSRLDEIGVLPDDELFKIWNTKEGRPVADVSLSRDAAMGKSEGTSSPVRKGVVRTGYRRDDVVKAVLDIDELAGKFSDEIIDLSKLESPIGVGGSSYTYYDEREDVFIKITRPWDSEERIFLSNVRTKNDAIHLAQLHDLGRQGHIPLLGNVGVNQNGTFWFKYEGIKGNVFTNKPAQDLSTAQIIDFFIKLTDILEVSHQKGVIHGDVMPWNIIINDDGQLMLIDFGLAGEKGDDTWGGAPGFFPRRDVKLSPKRDIYGLGKTIISIFGFDEDGHRIISDGDWVKSGLKALTQGMSREVKLLRSPNSMSKIKNRLIKIKGEFERMGSVAGGGPASSPILETILGLGSGLGGDDFSSSSRRSRSSIERPKDSDELILIGLLSKNAVYQKRGEKNIRIRAAVQLASSRNLEQRHYALDYLWRVTTNKVDGVELSDRILASKEILRNSSHNKEMLIYIERMFSQILNGEILSSSEELISVAMYIFDNHQSQQKNSSREVLIRIMHGEGSSATWEQRIAVTIFLSKRLSGEEEDYADNLLNQIQRGEKEGVALSVRITAAKSISKHMSGEEEEYADNLLDNVQRGNKQFRSATIDDRMNAAAFNSRFNSGEKEEYADNFLDDVQRGNINGVTMANRINAAMFLSKYDNNEREEYADSFLYDIQRGKIDKVSLLEKIAVVMYISKRTRGAEMKFADDFLDLLQSGGVEDATLIEKLEVTLFNLTYLGGDSRAYAGKIILSIVEDGDVTTAKELASEKRRLERRLTRDKRRLSRDKRIPSLSQLIEPRKREETFDVENIYKTVKPKGALSIALLHDDRYRGILDDPELLTIIEEIREKFSYDMVPIKGNSNQPNRGQESISENTIGVRFVSISGADFINNRRKKLEARAIEIYNYLFHEREKLLEEKKADEVNDAPEDDDSGGSGAASSPVDREVRKDEALEVKTIEDLRRLYENDDFWGREIKFSSSIVDILNLKKHKIMAGFPLPFGRRWGNTETMKIGSDLSHVSLIFDRDERGSEITATWISYKIKKGKVKEHKRSQWQIKSQGPVYVDPLLKLKGIIINRYIEPIDGELDISQYFYNDVDGSIAGYVREIFPHPNGSIWGNKNKAMKIGIKLSRVGMLFHHDLDRRLLGVTFIGYKQKGGQEVEARRRFYANNKGRLQYQDYNEVIRYLYKNPPDARYIELDLTDYLGPANLRRGLLPLNFPLPIDGKEWGKQHFLRVGIGFSGLKALIYFNEDGTVMGIMFRSYRRDAEKNNIMVGRSYYEWTGSEYSFRYRGKMGIVYWLYKDSKGQTFREEDISEALGASYVKTGQFGMMFLHPNGEQWRKVERIKVGIGLKRVRMRVEYDTNGDPERVIFIGFKSQDGGEFENKRSVWDVIDGRLVYQKKDAAMAGSALAARKDASSPVGAVTVTLADQQGRSIENIGAIVFDWDDTIFYTRKTAVSKWREIQRDLILRIWHGTANVSVEKQEAALAFVNRDVGLPDPLRFENAIKENPNGAGKNSSGLILEKIVEENDEQIIGLAREDLPKWQESPDEYFVPGAIDKIKELHELGIEVYIATANPWLKALNIVKLFGLSAYVQDVFTKQSTQFQKYSKGAAIDFVKKERESKPGIVVMIGDGKGDKDAADEAGVKFVAFAHSREAYDEFTLLNADMILTEPYYENLAMSASASSPVGGKIGREDVEQTLINIFKDLGIDPELLTSDVITRVHKVMLDQKQYTKNKYKQAITDALGKKIPRPVKVGYLFLKQISQKDSGRVDKNAVHSKSSVETKHQSIPEQINEAIERAIASYEKMAKERIRRRGFVDEYAEIKPFEFEGKRVAHLSVAHNSRRAIDLIVQRMIPQLQGNSSHWVFVTEDGDLDLDSVHSGETDLFLNVARILNIPIEPMIYGKYHPKVVQALIQEVEQAREFNRNQVFSMILEDIFPIQVSSSGEYSTSVVPSVLRTFSRQWGVSYNYLMKRLHANAQKKRTHNEEFFYKLNILLNRLVTLGNELSRERIRKKLKSYPDISNIFSLSGFFHDAIFEDAATADPASSPVSAKKPGGIDLNPEMIEMDKQGTGVHYQFPAIDLQHLQNINIEGFLPVIINISPITDIPLLLGISDTEEKPTDLGYQPLDPLEKRDHYVAAT